MDDLVHSLRYRVYYTYKMIKRIIPLQAQKAMNEVYRSFNALQSPVVILDFHLPRGMSKSFAPLS